MGYLYSFKITPPQILTINKGETEDFTVEKPKRHDFNQEIKVNIRSNE